MIERYEVLQQPCNSWAVFDALSGLPVEHRGRVLFGLSEETAREAVSRLNAHVPPESRYRPAVPAHRAA